MPRAGDGWSRFLKGIFPFSSDDTKSDKPLSIAKNAGCDGKLGKINKKNRFFFERGGHDTSRAGHFAKKFTIYD